MRSSQIKNATYLSCGCAKLNNSTKHVRHNESVHGGNHTKEYKTWQIIKQRCANQLRYVNKGIKMCDDWAQSYPAFLAYVGRAPTSAHTMDRIDNAKGYEPGNVRWATMKQQQRNRTDNRLITYKGKTQPLATWAEELGFNYSTLQSRIHTQGLTFKQAITKPIRKRLP